MIKDIAAPGFRKWAPNGSPIETMDSIQHRTAAMIHVSQLMPKEMAAAYSTPLTGSQPNGMGFTFGDTFRRTERSPMEFQLPYGQVDTIDRSLRYAFENVYIGKAMRVKTNFTCKGLSNAGPDQDINDFFDEVVTKLYLQRIYRQAVWLYYTVGIVPIIMPPPGKSLSYIEILDPRMVRIQRVYGKTVMYLIPDNKMIKAMQDPKGDTDVFNKTYYDAMPNHWKSQLKEQATKGGGANRFIIKLDPEEYVCLENRYSPFDRMENQWDGAPLQHYFSAAETYRMLCAGDFAAAFLAKNLIALVSVGDPKAEGDRYMRPDDKVLGDLQAAFQNPNSAQWAYVDPTTNIRYITPDPKVFDSAKYASVKEEMKNLLPSPFWHSETGGAFADATVRLKEMQEEVDQCNDDFDTNFWKIVYKRAALTTKSRVAKSKIRAPKHDRNSLQNTSEYLTSQNNLYANGGLSVPSLMEAHGIDPEVETQRLKDQQSNVKSGVYMPAFEQKQGIVAEKTYGIKKAAAAKPGAKKPGKNGKGGRPAKAGSKPNAESTTSRQPRPSAGS